MAPPSLILAGSGLSGLTLALELARRPFFQDKRIVLIDRDDKSRNDRTWCFWAKAGESLPQLAHKTWDQCLFFGERVEKVLDIAPYQYHMIRGLNYYNWAKSILTQCSNVQFIQANILEIDAQNGIVKTDSGDYQGEWVFNSAQFSAANTRFLIDGAKWDSSKLPTRLSDPKAPHSFLLQHFKGWLIETPMPAFDPKAMTFMDYRLEQDGNTRFVYVLPFSKTQALVEFTVFSPSLLAEAAYDAALNKYLSEVLNIHDFKVKEEEFGVIPMTDLALPSRGNGRLIHIGTAGGFVKASSGYAFLRTQRKIRAFVDEWERSGVPEPQILQSSRLFQALDSIMLRVLQEGTVSGKQFFSLLFKKLPAPLVFRFLDEDAKWTDILRVLSAPPTWPFFTTALRQLPFLLKSWFSKK